MISLRFIPGFLDAKVQAGWLNLLENTKKFVKLLHITFGLLAGMQKTHLNEVKSLYLFIGYLFKESYEFDGLLSSLVFTADESLSGRGFILEISTAKLDPEGN